MKNQLFFLAIISICLQTECSASLNPNALPYFTLKSRLKIASLKEEENTISSRNQLDTTDITKRKDVEVSKIDVSLPSDRASVFGTEIQSSTPVSTRKRK